MTEALKACPFCGKVPQRVYQCGWVSAFPGDVYCTKPAFVVDHMCNRGGATEAEAIAAWNHRTSPSAAAMQQALEALRKAVGWFADYERQHRAKRTQEGALKADVNADRSGYVAAAISALEAAMQPGEGEVERLQDEVESALTIKLLDYEIEEALVSEGIYVWGPDGERFERMFAVVMNARRAAIAAMGER
jgi:hypothetical protein